MKDVVVTIALFLMIFLPYILPYLLVVLMPRWYLAVAAAFLLATVALSRLLLEGESYARGHLSLNIGLYQLILATVAVALAARLMTPVLRGHRVPMWVLIPLHVAAFLALPVYLARTGRL